MSSAAAFEEGRKTFANTLKYVLTTMSANLGNMISMAAASLFLPFLPLLAGQILLNNLLSDVPAIGIADDAVDPELIERPQRWNMRFIGRFMVEFGAVSSVFDFLTFGVLLLVFRAGAGPVQNGMVRRIAAHRARHRAGRADAPALLPKPAGPRAAVVDGGARGADLRHTLSAIHRRVRVRAVAGRAARHGRCDYRACTSSPQKSPSAGSTAECYDGRHSTLCDRPRRAWPHSPARLCEGVRVGRASAIVSADLSVTRSRLASRRVSLSRRCCSTVHLAALAGGRLGRARLSSRCSSSSFSGPTRSLAQSRTLSC